MHSITRPSTAASSISITSTSGVSWRCLFSNNAQRQIATLPHCASCRKRKYALMRLCKNEVSLLVRLLQRARMSANLLGAQGLFTIARDVHDVLLSSHSCGTRRSSRNLLHHFLACFARSSFCPLCWRFDSASWSRRRPFGRRRCR